MLSTARRRNTLPAWKSNGVSPTGLRRPRKGLSSLSVGSPCADATDDGVTRAVLNDRATVDCTRERKDGSAWGQTTTSLTRTPVSTAMYWPRRLATTRSSRVSKDVFGWESSSHGGVVLDEDTITGSGVVGNDASRGIFDCGFASSSITNASKREAMLSKGHGVELRALSGHALRMEVSDSRVRCAWKRSQWGLKLSNSRRLRSSQTRTISCLPLQMRTRMS